MHQSCLKNHICVLRWISRSHARNENKIQTSGRRRLAGKIEKLDFLIHLNRKHDWKSWNLAWCHDMAPTCYGNFFGRIGTSIGTSFLQNRRFSQEGSWFREGTCHLRVQNEIRTLPSPALIFLHRQIRPNRITVLNFGIITCSFGLFYTLFEFLRI